MKRTIITGTGCYIPEEIKLNLDFLDTEFYTEDHIQIQTESREVLEKFQQITGIKERRYAPPKYNTSDIGAIAAERALAESGIDKESLDHIIVAHNFGNVTPGSFQTDAVPSLASRIKNYLKINNPSCIPYDVLFGCPGWVQGVIQANMFFKAGYGTKALVVGTETLSRVVDEHDRDSMIFSDGAGACVLEYKEDQSSGLLSFNVASHSNDETYFIKMDRSYHPDFKGKDIRYIKMKGRKVYEYAITEVPKAIKQCIEKAGLHLNDIKKIFIHQANEKMDEVIIKNLFKLYGQRNVNLEIMPMCIQWLGNSSVATIPTLYDLVLKNKIEGQEISKGDIVLFASVGAGMNINAICYKV